MDSGKLIIYIKMGKKVLDLKFNFKVRIFFWLISLEEYYAFYSSISYVENMFVMG